MIRLPELQFGLFEEQFLPAPCYAVVADDYQADNYQSAIWHPLPAAVVARITSDASQGIVRSWNENGPPTSHLSYVQITHLDMNKKPKLGELVVHRELAREVEEISFDIFSASFPIEQQRLIDYWNADDEASMTDNNSSALCVRRVTSGSTLSNHALGRAWDINPKWNPYHNKTKEIVAPVAGQEFLDRSQDRPGMIKEGDAVVKAFDARGWEWGGRWIDPVDYQHFQKPIKV
jgi:hypothetical protein